MRGAAAAVVLCALSATVPAQAGGLQLSEAQWLAHGADAVAALSAAPGECLRKARNADERFLVEAGRAAFRTPLLLGGPAARNGLSCNSCHRNGNDNAGFFLDGLSDRPGTADVTSSLFSKSREDGAFNPVAIPTLVGSGEKQSFGTMAPQPSLHAFIGSAVGEEFQGAPPPKAVLEGLAAYVAHLDAKSCTEKTQRISVRAAMSDVERALIVARDALERGDTASADFLLLAAQRSLRPVYERYEGEELAGMRVAVETLGREIGALRPIAAAAPQDAIAGVRAAEKQSRELSSRLHKQRKKSLYDLQVLQRAVEGAPNGD